MSLFIFYKILNTLSLNRKEVRKLKENCIYDFKKEFCQELGIPMNQAERRLNELLEWLKNFYDFEFIPGRPNRIMIKEIIGEYQPLPRKIRELTQEKKEKYTDFTIASFSEEYRPNSKARVAREAMNQFGFKEYGHINVKAVIERYVKDPFNQYGETNHNFIWVYYRTYEPLDEETVQKWRQILREEKIGETEAANAFYRQENGEDISAEKSYYKNATERFRDEYNDIPVLVSEWRIKKK